MDLQPVHYGDGVLINAKCGYVTKCNVGHARDYPLTYPYPQIVLPK